jgi:hypothetical protein
METTIGVFASRDRAEEAVKELKQHVPEDSIVFLTRSENEAKAVGKEFGAFVGGFTGGAAGMSAGVVAATLLVPGLGTIFALGSLPWGVAHDSQAPQPTPDEKVFRRCGLLPGGSERGAFSDRGSDGITGTRDLGVRCT